MYVREVKKMYEGFEIKVERRDQTDTTPISDDSEVKSFYNLNGRLVIIKV